MSTVSFTSVPLLIPVLLVTALTASAQAQPHAPSTSDIKTAPEPSRAPDVLAPRRLRAGAAQEAPLPPRKQAIDPRAPISSSTRIDRNRTYFDEPGDGSVWVRGANYKASFDDSGATYYPLFGARQPRHYPHALSPDRVTIGGAPIEFERAPAPVRDGDHVELRHGSFVEAYDCAPRSIEQTFVFASIPAMGELVLHIPIASELERRETAAGFEFRSELGRMSYGRATAVDAAGRRAGASTTLDDGGITIHVGAAFLADAAFPLVIDPVVTTFDIDTSSFNDLAADVSYDATYDRWLVVYEDIATANDKDVFYVMLNNAGLYLWGGYINSNTTSWNGARCANVHFANQFLVVASAQGSGDADIRGRFVQAGISSVGSEFNISGTGDSGPKYSPSIGGERDPSSSASYCVAYERVYGPGDNDILVRTVRPDGTVSATNFLSNSGGTLDGSPSVSRSANGFAWTVAWGRVMSAAYDVWAARVAVGLTVDAPAQVTSGGIDGLPCVSSLTPAHNRTLVVFERNYGTDHDIEGVVLEGTVAIQQVDLTILEGAQVFQNQITPYVDSDDTHYVVAYAEQFSTSTTDYDIYYSDFVMPANALVLRQTHVNLAYTGAREGTVRLASTRSAGGANRRFMAVWDRASSSTNNDVLGALLDTNDGGTSSLSCFGDGTAGNCPCGNNGVATHGCGSSVNSSGALLNVSGSLSTVNDTTVLHVLGMPATAVCLFYQGTVIGNASAFGDGLNCTGGTVMRLATKTAGDGATAYPGPGDAPISSHGGVPPVGGMRNYQVWYRNSAVFCTSSTFNLTNGVRIDWAQ